MIRAARLLDEYQESAQIIHQGVTKQEWTWKMGENAQGSALQ